MTLQHSWDNQRGIDENQLPESMGDGGIQGAQYEYGRRVYEPTFNCDAKVHGAYPG